MPPAASPLLGEVQELSDRHAMGWLFDPASPDTSLPIRLVLPETGEVVASAVADKFWWGLANVGVADGRRAFWVGFDRRLTADEVRNVEVRAAGSDLPLPRRPGLNGGYEPVLHVAMDIVDNCNLRCPFCLFDYAHSNRTNLMDAATLDAALRFVPFAKDGEFWFSCLHEPTLHPELIDYVERVPRQYRRKLFYTTNLAKRMPPGYFEWLAGNGMHHVNVSIESQNPEIYERMRKGARWRIFSENLDRLTEARGRERSPTPVRYIAMAYRSNLRELPDLARYLIEHRGAAQVEIRYTYDVPYIPAEFRQAEFLDDTEWDWLEGELARLEPAAIQFSRPPRRVDAAASPPAEPAAVGAATKEALLGPVMLRLSRDGTMKVLGIHARSSEHQVTEELLRTLNVRDIPDADAFLHEMTTLRGRRADAVGEAD